MRAQLLALVALAGCAAPPALELIETAPVETALDAPDLRPTHEVWLELISAAQATLELGHFYASDRAPSRLTAVIEALEAAAARGVAVRFLAHAGFHGTYPETLDRLAAVPGIQVRLYSLPTGGAHHAKYLIADGAVACAGSANFDWRSLEHVQELSLVARDGDVAAALADVFELDWHLAAGGARATAPQPTAVARDFPAGRDRVTPVASPRDLLPTSIAWDLPRLVALLDGARRSARVQLLSYGTEGNDGARFGALEDALLRAAQRGVLVQMLIADWATHPGRIDELKRLQRVPGIEVRLLSIPEAREGFVPFSRVAHAKYMVADGARAWLGTSNWSRGYFEADRNVGFVVEAGRIPGRLEGFFLTNWTSEHAETVDPEREYAPRRYSE